MDKESWTISGPNEYNFLALEENRGPRHPDPFLREAAISTGGCLYEI
jgi:hypothetical protein